MHRRSAHAVAASVLCALVAASGTTVFAADKLVPVWRAKLHGLAALAWQPRNPATPLLARKHVLFAAANGVHALDAGNGAPAWRHETTEAVAGSPILHEGLVRVVTAEGHVQSLRPTDGKPAWVKPTKLGAVVHAGLAAEGPRLFAMADPAVLTAIRAADGKILWRNSRPITRSFLVEGHGAPAVHNGVVYAGLANGKLVALAVRDGAVVWELAVNDRGDGPYVDVDHTPLLGTVGGAAALFVTGHNSGLHALAAADGQRLWRYKATGLGQPVKAGQTLVSVAPDGGLHIVAARSGKRRLGRRVLGDPSGQVAVAGRWLLVPGAGSLQVVERATGHSIWHVVDEHGFAAAPLVVGDDVFALANNGTAWRLALK